VRFDLIVAYFVDCSIVVLWWMTGKVCHSIQLMMMTTTTTTTTMMTMMMMMMMMMISSDDGL